MFHFITLLRPAVLSACLHVKTSYTTDGANVCGAFSDALFIQIIFLFVLYLNMNLLTSLLSWLYRKCCPTKRFFFVAGLLFFNFPKIKHLDEWNEKYKISKYLDLKIGSCKNSETSVCI